MRAESERIFGHVMGNDPRPHYFHQTNLAESDNPEGAVFYPVLNAMLADYSRWFNGERADRAADADADQRPDRAPGRHGRAPREAVSGYIEGARVTIVNSGATTVAR